MARTLPAPAGDGKVTQFPIKRAVECVPGGMMVVPLLCGALFATLAPGTPGFFGSFTGALFTGALPILAVFFVCTGASIDFRATPYILRKGGALFAVKVGIGILLGVVFASANPVYAAAAAQATILVAACVVVTAIVVPLATAWTARRVGARKS